MINGSTLQNNMCNGPDNTTTDCNSIYKSCMMEEIKAKFGGVSILINNAGITRDTPLWKMSLTQWHEVISSNLDSVFNCTRHVIEDMIEQKFGRIINISSVNGRFS